MATWFKKTIKPFNHLTINCKGFTLIELLIVVAIIGILGSLLMANFIGIRQRARDVQRKSDLRQIQSALEIYRADLGSYPITASFPACGSALTGGSPLSTYMQKIPCDPLATPAYSYTSSGTTYTLLACLENLSDLQKDTSNVAPCIGGTTNWSYTLQNP